MLRMENSEVNKTNGTGVADDIGDIQLESLPVRRPTQWITPQQTRVIAKFFNPGGRHRRRHIIDRVLGLSEESVHRHVEQVFSEFEHRHRNFRDRLLDNYRVIREFVPDEESLSEGRRLLIGACFTHEYSISSAAFTNPSIVPHFDQSNLPEGATRFIMSFRAIGEGHISSIEFRSGVVAPDGTIRFDEESRYLQTPRIQVDRQYERKLFRMKLEEIGVLGDVIDRVMEHVPAWFTQAELNAAIRTVREEPSNGRREIAGEEFEAIRWLAESNYSVIFPSDIDISERVIYPISEAESNGIEDARFVRFTDDDESITYYATYTAYDGFHILPQMVETTDFVSFKVLTLNGEAAHNKGMALFPRKINGRYAMLGRQDGENQFIMYSENIHFWHESELLRTPRYLWEVIQVGNNGSPIETDEGWLVITHGVGPMRKYCLGAMLLDLNDPAQVIGALDVPLICPNTQEREGYVPNVVYTCGAIVTGDTLLVPYSMSDTASGVAHIPLAELLGRLKADRGR